MKLHLYFFSSYLAQKPLSKRCNALRLLHPAPYLLRQSAGAVLLNTMPSQSNKKGDQRPDSANVLALYRLTLVWRGLIVC